MNHLTAPRYQPVTRRTEAQLSGAGQGALGPGLMDRVGLHFHQETRVKGNPGTETSKAQVVEVYRLVEYVGATDPSRYDRCQAQCDKTDSSTGRRDGLFFVARLREAQSPYP